MAAAMLAGEAPATKILRHLQRHGEATVRDLEGLLGVSTTAVREHLTHLQARDLVANRLVRHGLGRPRSVYFLTAVGKSQFPKGYDTLVNLLLRELAARHPEELDVLLEAVGARLADEYRGEIAGVALHERLEGLRLALEARSIPVAVQASDASFEVLACPYLDVAQEHAVVCQMERHALEQALGESLKLAGTIREGNRSCHFVVAKSVEHV